MSPAARILINQIAPHLGGSSKRSFVRRFVSAVSTSSVSLLPSTHQMLERIPGWIFVVGVSLLIATIAYSTQLFIFLPALGGWNAESLKLLGPFNVLVLLVYYNYFLACSTDPGRVPAGWEPPYSTFASNRDDSNDASGKKRWRQNDLRATDTGMTGPRFCKSCKTYKPPRTHHCRYCRRCVLKMDHHCPWISNCVGNDNYGHFVRFVLYVDIACGYALGLLIWRVRRIMDDIRHFRFQAEPSTTEVVFLVLNFILAFIVIFCVGVLSIYHLYCMAKNQSSIESWERSKVKSLIRRGKILPVNYPYDVGLYRNICAVLGPNPLLWMVPQRCVGDGLTFPVRPGTDPRLPYCWPPRDPDDLRPSIFSARYKRQQEKELRRNRRAPHLVRRDSEGYLVREITLEDRMRMLKNMETEPESSETLDNSFDYDDEDDEIDSVEDYYDSGSYVTDSDAELETEQMFEERTQWMQDRVMDLSGGADEDYYEYGGQAWDDGEQGVPSERQHLMHHQQGAISDENYYDSDDGVPLAAYQQTKFKASAPALSGKASKED